MITGAIGLGCMRLSTDPDVGDEHALSVLREALAAGVTIFDTANAYGLDEPSRGSNEKLIARALADFRDRRAITVVTKGGMTRPKGAWVPDGRKKALIASCAASLEALGASSLDMFLLHAIDPRTPLETSARALRGLLDEGVVRAVGLSNVTLGELRRAAAIVPITMVSVAFSVLDDTAIRGGLLEHCVEHDIRLLAHSPLGGPRAVARLRKHAALRKVAARHAHRAPAGRQACTEETVALAWLYGLAPVVTPIPGARSVAAVKSGVAAAELVLTQEDVHVLDSAFEAGPLARAPRRSRRPRAASRSVTMIMGVQGAGKSSAIEKHAPGFDVRLNRDERGGKLRDLIRPLEEALARDAKVVLDNTYGSRVERNRVLEAAWSQGADVRCVFLDTPLAEAQINLVDRMLDRYGRLLEPAELKAEARSTEGIFGPEVPQRYLRSFEPPEEDEGFASIERVAFTRRVRGQGSGVLFDLATLRDGDRFEVRRDVLARARDDEPAGVMVWRPSLPTMSDEAFDEAMTQLVASARRPLDRLVCSHPAGPPVCWCRRPLPGLAVKFARTHGLSLTGLRFVSQSDADRTLAAALSAECIAPS